MKAWSSLVFTILALSLWDSVNSKLYDQEQPCGPDVKKHCAPGLKNEFSAVQCLQREIETDSSAVSKECHQALWDFKVNIMGDKRYVDQMKKQCPEQMETLCKGRTDEMTCLLENRQKVENDINGGTCKRYLKSMAIVFFSDYHLIHGFIEKCSDDVKKLSCGVIVNNADESVSTQAQVISCLEGKIKRVSAECKTVLTKKEEQASDSFKLDRALFQACRNDRDVLCKDTPDSVGEVYACLARFKFDKRLSAKCRKEVARRQLMTLEDYKIDYGLKASCGEDLVTQHCLDLKTSKRLQEGFMRTVLLMQCLTEINDMGDQRRVPVSDKCLREVGRVKRMIMGDIELSPQLGVDCHNDVQNHCSDAPKNQEGAVINCLLALAPKVPNEGGLEPQCRNAVEEFMEVVDPISDYKLNYALMDNCGDYIEDHCKMEQGEGEVMKCLIELELEMEFNLECHQQVLSYKYFMSRSIKLDKPLLNACREDAQRLCMTELEEEQTAEHKPHGAVVSCLYHHIFSDADKLSNKCMPELKRIIIAQGESVNLSPAIVSSCAEDLVAYCAGFESNKDDYGCLQQRMLLENTPNHGEKLSPNCLKEMEHHAELVSQDVRNDYRFMKACKEPIRQKCKEELRDRFHGNLLGCIEKNKAFVKGSCLKHVKDLQLVSLFDYKFNKAFVEACGSAVQTYCKADEYGREIKKKQDVMYCLRNQLNQGTPKNKEPISEDCKGQLRAEFLKQMSDLDLDPQLLSACAVDLKRTCRLDEFGDKTQVMECLRKNELELSPSCKNKVFEREVQQAEDPDIDPVLQKSCRVAISKYCSESQGDELMSCLESNQHRSGVTHECKTTLRLRMLKEHSNYLLNMGLRKSCKEDIKMFCKSTLDGIKNGSIQDGKGAVISCLKKNMDKISVECEDSMTTILEQEVEDYKLDPVLSRFCANDISVVCPDSPDDEVEGCLRDHIMAIQSEDCTKQVVRLITETHADVHLDPLLMKACQKDIGYLCGRLVPGRGQIIECLQSNQARDKNALTPTCNSMLKSRVQMWYNAYERAKQYDSALEMVDDIYRSIESSKYKHEILAYIGFALCALILLSFCGGRCTKSKPPSKLY